MKTTLFNRINFAATFVAVALLLGGCKDTTLVEEELSSISVQQDAKGTPTETGQSVQVNVDGLQQIYTIEGTETWSFDYAGQLAAVANSSTYFNLTQTGSPSATDIQKLKHEAFKANKCNFYLGLPLASFTLAKTNGPVAQQYSITATPKSAGALSAKTGWTSEITGGEPKDINLENIYVASASYQKTAKTSKYSFSLLDSYNVPRLSDLKIELLKSSTVDGNKVTEVLSTVTKSYSSVENNADWTYVGIQPYFGSSSVFPALDAANNATVKATQQNSFDTFANNDNTGGSRALFDNVSFEDLSLDGDYSIRISGAIKGNEFVNKQDFTITKNFITISDCK